MSEDIPRTCGTCTFRDPDPGKKTTYLYNHVSHEEAGGPCIGVCLNPEIEAALNGNPPVGEKNHCHFYKLDQRQPQPTGRRMIVV